MNNNKITNDKLNYYIDSIVDIHKSHFNNASNAHRACTQSSSFTNTGKDFVHGLLRDAYKQQCVNDLRNLLNRYDLNTSQKYAVYHAIGFFGQAF